MFFPRAAPTRLRHDRVLQSFGRPRGLLIEPDPGPGKRPSETAHQGSVVVCSPERGIAIVVEWSADRSELHRVALRSPDQRAGWRRLLRRRTQT